MTSNRSAVLPKTQSGPLTAPDIDVVSDYRILQQIYESAGTRIYRARHGGTGQSVVLKMPREQPPDRDTVARYKNELRINRAIQGSKVIRCTALVQLPNTLALVVEDVSGRPLRDFLANGPLSVRQALVYGSQIADGLADVHAAQVVHKDINPDNLIIVETTGALKIADFGSSTMLAREQSSVVSPNVLEGTLTYMPPEQTGRTNRAIDHRSDFYSFGATLYEMLTGKPPFVSDDPLDLIHYHIAKQPVPPSKVKPDVPSAVSDIVMKLLAKMAEDRYQSARGIKADLDECLKQLEQRDSIASFTLARHDRPQNFQIPQKLYGREKKVELLLAKFENVAGGGREMVLVGGYSGIGKTSLIREVYKPITERHGYFISGKFDQFRRNTPYKAVADALRDLIKQLLTESEERLAYWRKQLSQALGSHAQLVIDAIPDLELIIGPQPAVATLGPMETQNRTNLVFRDFVQVFCQPSHPLVMFLDDLQWIDSASLKFLTHLMKDESARHLMLIGAYRNNEVDPAHPLMIAMQSVKKAGIVIDNLMLEPLTLDDVGLLVSEALLCPASEAHTLAELTFNKTGGNPFFIEEFLKSLYAEHLLSFNLQRGRWDWDIDRIRGKQVTDNVVDLMTEKLARLSPDTQRVLALASCLGNRFDVSTLATIYQRSVEDTLVALRQALQNGVVDAIGSSSNRLMVFDATTQNDAAQLECRFSHDRIQQAAYGLISESEKPALHKSIGGWLLKNTPEHARDEKIFEIVTHLSLGATLIVDQVEHENFARLALKAALIAKYSGAYDTAFRFLKAALAGLAADSWRQRYESTFRLYASTADAAYLVDNFEEMNRLCEAALAHAAGVLDKIKIVKTKMAAEQRRGKLSTAIALGLEALTWLGLHLPAKPSRLAVAWSRFKLKLALIGKSDDDLVNGTNTPDPYSAAKSSLLGKIGSAAYHSNPRLLAIQTFESLRAGLEQPDRNRAGAAVYAAYGYMLCSELGDIDAGTRYGELALQLADKSASKQEKTGTYCIVNSMIRHWKQPMRETLHSLLEGYQQCLEAGDLHYAASNLLAYCYQSFHSGKELTGLAEEFTTYDAAIKNKLQMVRQYQINALYHQAILNLLGTDKDVCNFSGSVLNGEDLVPKWEKSGEQTNLHTYYFLKTTLSYLFGRYAEALQFSDKAKHVAHAVTGTSTAAIAVFYDSLARLAAYPVAQPAEQHKLLSDIDRNQNNLKIWSQHAPANYRHKFLLIEAELERIHGSELAAINGYEQSIALARTSEYVQDEALANELAGKFHTARERPTVALAYLRQALRCYQRWGARAKVEELQHSYPELARQKERNVFTGTISAGATVAALLAPSKFDLRALTKALKGITQEKTYSQLLEKTILTAMEFAGADTGALILRKTEERLCVEAEVSMNQEKPIILQSIPVEDATNVSQAIVNYVKRTKQNVVINDARDMENAVPGLHLEPYIKTGQIKSVLCIPLMTESTGDDKGLVGLLYLENRQASDSFDEKRIETLEIICLAAAGRLELSRRAMTDGLTDLYNHDSFQSLLLKEFATASRLKRALSVVMVDIDHFKKFNDQWGHQAGDAVLREVAASIKKSCRQSDVVARYGGEEMAVILPETDNDRAQQVAERIRANIETLEVKYNDSALKVTASLGLATLSPSTKDPGALVKLADIALYASKSKGRNQVSVA